MIIRYRDEALPTGNRTGSEKLSIHRALDRDRDSDALSTLQITAKLFSAIPSRMRFSVVAALPPSSTSNVENIDNLAIGNVDPGVSQYFKLPPRCTFVELILQAARWAGCGSDRGTHTGTTSDVVSAPPQLS